MLRLVSVREEVFKTSSKIQKLVMKPEDKVVAVLIRNQGTAICKTGIDQQKPQGKTLPGGSMPYGIEGSVLTGILYIEFDGADGEAIAVIYTDKGELNC